MVNVNRYLDLSNEIPKGSFWDQAGVLLPLQDAPHELRFTTSPAAPTTRFGVFVNEVFTGVVTTDVDGVAVVRVQLNPGRFEIRLENDIDATNLRAYIDIRNTATWHAAYAETIEAIDANIDATEDGRILEKARPDFLADVFGKLVLQPNDITFGTESYRRTLRQLRQAYRLYGAREAGLFEVVASYTAVNPVLINGRNGGPRWILGTDSIRNGDLELSAREIAPAFSGSLPNLNNVSIDFVHAGFAGNDGASSFPGPFTDPPIPQRLAITFAAGWDGGDITIIGTNELGANITDVVLAAPASTVNSAEEFFTVTSATKSAVGASAATVSIGLATSRFINILDIAGFNEIDTGFTLAWDGTDMLTWRSEATQITESGQVVLKDPAVAAEFTGFALDTYDTQVFNVLHINIDDIGLISIQLTAGAAVTAATMVTDINTALAADGRYGVTYNSVASVVTSATAVAGDVIKLTSPTTGETSKIKIDLGPADAAFTILGVPKLNTALDTDANTKDINMSVASSAAFPTFGDQSSSINMRVGRGLRASGADGETVVLSTVFALFGDTVLPLIARHEILMTGWIRITGAVNADNNGIHKIVGINGAGEPGITLLNSNGVTFIAETSLDWELFSLGDVIEVTGNDLINDNMLFGNANATSLVTPLAANDGSNVFVAAPGLSFPIDLVTTQQIAITVGSGWDGGDINLFGTRDDGSAQSEVINPTDLGFVSNRFWRTITGASKTVIGASAAEVDIFTRDDLLFDQKFSGDFFEQAGDVPFEVTGRDGIKTLTVDIDITLAPGVESDIITFEGSVVPDGWLTTNADLTVVANGTGYDFPGFFQDHRLFLVGDGVGDMSIERNVPDALKFAGLFVNVDFWIQHSIGASEDFVVEVSFDNGSTYTAVAGSPFSVAGDVYVAGDSPLCPQLISGDVDIPLDATSVIVRLRHAGTAAGEIVMLEKVSVTQPFLSGLSVGSNTVPRAQSRAKFRELLYVWSPDVLPDIINDTLGLFVLPERKLGQIDLISHAHGFFDRFNVTEFSGGVPINLAGIFNEVDFIGSTLTNMELAVGTPDRLTAIVPSTISTVTGEILTVAGGPNTATVAFESDVTGIFPVDPLGPDNAILFEDGVPVVEDTWRWNSTTEIEITSGFNALAVYTLNYSKLTKFESSNIDLGAAFADYLWFVDLFDYIRTDTSILEEAITEPINFLADFSAQLNFVADGDQTRAQLNRDDGVTKTIVPVRNWRFVNVQTIQISPNSFDPNSIYTLDYIAKSGLQSRVPTVIREIRTAATEGGLAAATYVPFRVNDIADTRATIANNFTKRWAQIRVTISDIVDVRDIIIYSANLKGLRFFGSDPSVPGITV